MAPKPPDGTFIIDSDLRPSLPACDSVLVWAHSAPEGRSFRVKVLAAPSSMCMYVCVSHLECTNKEGSSVKEKKGWFPLECEFLLLFCPRLFLISFVSHVHNAIAHTLTHRYLSSTLLLLCASFFFFFFFCISHKTVAAGWSVLQMEAKR